MVTLQNTRPTIGKIDLRADGDEMEMVSVCVSVVISDVCFECVVGVFFFSFDGCLSVFVGRG